ncbi:MAG TPA: non-reducing end alpha-L-arabinofuranosidase family hydrolase [Actinophytocola sp.]|uniref:non-reducing end alpha-L-arabinofuranosidase family hydrolase n=1 Tax=Actinophytocola sp. TaxID=1872138 RepID=UPI002DDCB030|nr:non-reducing end alpha-L-arabinofuranosidase family hydrolase [Actinophytocola sp.]HEV2784508.1 non-reducing end alpha-L-arabinofuranosidase family hydrolase [Actinophytocola sp.]
MSRYRSIFGSVAAAALLAGLLLPAGTTGAEAATVDPSAWYVLVNRNSGKAMDVSGVSTSDGAVIHQWTRHDGANQQWQFVDSGGGFYRLRARHSGKVLDVSGASTADGAAVVQWSDHTGTNQQFRLADSPDGFVRLINRNSGKAVEVQGASTADGARVVQFADGGGANQQWRLVPLGGSSGPLPSTFRWSSSGVLAGPKPDAQHPDAVAVKDFSVVRHNNQWLIYATTAGPTRGWGLVHYAFGDWSQAASAPHTYLDTASAIGPGYRAAPQLFHFAPQNLWYLVYQSAPPTYSTSTNPADPRSWSAPRTFIAQEPPIVTQNKGPGQWIDFWVICDSANCFLFFSDDNGHIYRAQASLGNFPNGFGNTQIVLSDSRFALFEATNVYKVAGSNQYLLIQEAIGSTGRRYFRSFTSTSLTGSWTPLAATENEPFAGRANVTFPNGAWTQDISHGEMIRASNDQTLTIDPCRLQYVYQGQDPNASGDYIRLPWRMGLLTQTNSPC